MQPELSRQRSNRVSGRIVSTDTNAACTLALLLCTRQRVLRVAAADQDGYQKPSLGALAAGRNLA